MQGPLWRIAGAVGGWLVFTFLGVLVLRAVWILMLLGGSCASGGPYAISVECPPVVLLIIPWAIFLSIAVVVAGAVMQRGFGTPLLSWAWPLGFGGLGVASIVGTFATGAPWYLVGGLMFLLFSVPVVVYELRGSPLRLFIGATNLREQGFLVRTGDLRKAFRRGEGDYPQVVDATIGDGVLAIALTLAAVAAGGWLGWIAFDALS